MKRVLWISRHQMTVEQRSDLERVMGEEVLPVELLAELVRLAGKRPVFQAAAVRTPTGRFHTLPDGRREPEFAFAHGGWQQILRLELEVKHLSKKS